MNKKQKTLIDVGMKDLPFPVKASSRVDSDGQATVANISINARIVHEFESEWIGRFLEAVHRHGDSLGSRTLRRRVMEYLRELNAAQVSIRFDYPFFVERLTPVSKERRLEGYQCSYCASMSASGENPEVRFTMEIPALTSDPASVAEVPGGLFGQLSSLTIEAQSHEEIYPEDLVEMVDRHALSPVLSHLTPGDERFVIHKVHSETVSSVELTEGVKEELERDPSVAWYAVRCRNFSLLRSYSTVVGAEKRMKIPSACYDFGQI